LVAEQVGIISKAKSAKKIFRQIRGFSFGKFSPVWASWSPRPD
jgi:hypothetical protein